MPPKPHRSTCRTAYPPIPLLVLTLLTVLVVVLVSANASARQIQSMFATSLSDSDFKTMAEFDDLKNLSQSGSYLSPFLVPRVSGTAGNKAVQQHIKDTFKALNWNVEEDTFNDTTPYGVKEFNNIIVTKDPTAQRKLVLAAHFDSKYFKNFDFIGATDSAVPCAILVDIATTLNPYLEKAMEQRLGRTDSTSVQFIFFDGEEAFVDWTATDSLYGSRHLAAKWEQTMVTFANGNTANLLGLIDVFILLDLLGTSEVKLVNMNRPTTWAWEKLVEIENRLLQQGLLSEAHRKTMVKSGEPGYFIPGETPFMGLHGIDDDHRPFRDRGVPIVHVIPPQFPSVWHKESDNGDAISPVVIQDFARIFRIFVVEYLGLI
ncbi:hypothetical protein HDV05_000552 [Chytridiales sp. JEL 0842]|nr:hypothetical protein HDV05_000552 [Chytridiales sp. JEL 0842]